MSKVVDTKTIEFAELSDKQSIAMLGIEFKYSAYVREIEGFGKSHMRAGEQCMFHYLFKENKKYHVEVRLIESD